LAADVDFSSKPFYWRPVTIEIRNQFDSETILLEESNIEEQAIHRHYFEICNRPFTDSDLFEALWQEVSMRVYYHHGAKYMRFSPSSRKVRSEQAKAVLPRLKIELLNRIASIHPKQNDFLLLYHMVTCESHRQMLSTSLGILAGEIKDLRNQESHQLADELMPWSRKVVPT
jgi:hypothetical protein